MNAKTFFEKHPAKADVYQTSDGTLFHKECDAKNHAKNLKDKNVKRIINFNAKPVKPATTTTEVASDDVIGAENATTETKVEGSEVEGSETEGEMQNAQSAMPPPTPITSPAPATAVPKSPKPSIGKK